MDKIINLEKVNKSYGNKIVNHVLKDITLSINQGEFVAIIGQSGSGKSTLLNIIGSLTYPTSGVVEIDKQNIMKLKKSELTYLRNQKIGFIFQFHYLLPEFNVLENVLMPYQITHSQTSKEAKNRALNLIEEVQLQQKVKTNIKDLSGGQQQRVAIARSLMNNPKLILADEPTGNLDSVSSENIYQLLRSINQKYQTTIIII
ncbi:MAG: ABC transporter ATP-binding protein, partial [Bacilli bacterium]